MAVGVEDRRRQPRGEDRRRRRRQKSFLGGQITYDDGLTRIDCLVRNLAPRGASLVIQRHAMIPDEFDLSIAGRARTFRARLVWRRDKEFGVRLSPLPVATSPARLEKRVRELEAANASLRRAMQNLS